MPLNCGIEALSKIADLKNVSAFTLIHLGRDNSLNLFFFKVNDLSDLPRVQRPAIFHQKDHFVYVKNGEAMPDGEYTGHVIGPAVLGRVLSMAEAKTVNGGKNFFTGKNSEGEQTGSGALKDIISVVVGAAVGLVGGPIAGAAAGAAAGAGYGAVERAQNQDVLGSPGDIGAIGKDLLVGGAEGYGGASISQGIAQAGSKAGTSALSSTIPTAGSAGANAAAAGAGTTFTAAGGGSALGGTVASFNAAQAANAAAASGLAGATSAFGGGTAAPSGVTGANAASLASAPGTTFTATNAASGASPSLFNTITSGVKQGVNNIGTDVKNINSSLGKATGGIIGGSSPINAGTIASGSGLLNPATIVGGAGVFGSKPPEYNGASPSANYSAVSQFLGPNALADAGKSANLDYVNTSIPDLQKQFTGNNQRTLDTINTAYDNQKNQLVHQYAQAGQNVANSSELQDKIGQLEQKRVNDLTLAQQELQNQALTQAVQVKQTALSQAMQSGQWNQQVAMELASLTGDQQNLQYAIANNNYESFQQIMGKIMTMGIPQQVSVTK